MEDFNTFLYDHTLHRRRKHICCYCLQAFCTEEILKSHVNECFKINGKQMIQLPKKVKSRLMIYADFESILVPQDNGKKNLKEPYANKYQKHVACSYGYKLVCVDHKFSKPFKSYPGQDAFCKCINSMIEQSKYCSDVIKKYFNKELVKTKKDDEDFEKSTKCWISDNLYDDGDVKVTDHCHITGKYRGSCTYRL